MPLELPVFQHFDCQSCGFCCRNLVVNVTPAERQRILDAGWQERLPNTELFIQYRFGGRRLIRLAHTPDKACVFLGADGRCSLHAETGIETKPFACRLYPFVPTPGVESVRLDMRCDCPSVAANRGRSVSAHQAEIVALAQESNVDIASRPPTWGHHRLEAREFRSIIAALDDCLTARELTWRGRIFAVAHLLDLMLAVQPGRVRGERFSELMHLLAADAREQAIEEKPPGSAPIKAQRLFRQWLFLHTIADDPQELACGRIERLRRSWYRYGQSRRFAAGAGLVPQMRKEWGDLTFEQIAAIPSAQPEALEPLVRSMRVKIQAYAFAGPAYYGYELLPGLTALVLLPALVGWLARANAGSQGHSALDASNMLEAVRQAHHTFGVSPVFSKISETLRLRALAHVGTPLALIQQYGA